MSRRRALIAVLIPVLLLGVQGLAYAKRGEDFVPPPYLTRLVASFVGVFPIAVLVVLICGAGAAWLTALPKPETRRLLIFSAVLYACGCAAAAMDGLNDESWNPTFLASAFLALIPGLTLYLNSERPRSVAFPLLILIIAIPVWFGLAIVGSLWQDWARAHGIPASW